VSFDYVRRFYGVPAKRGGRVSWVEPTFGNTLHGTIVSASHYVHVRFDGAELVHRFHPTDPGLTYATADKPSGEHQHNDPRAEDQ
jgi:hypothetical protein